MTKYRSPGTIRTHGPTRTAEEIARDRELRLIHAAAVERRRTEAALACSARQATPTPAEPADVQPAGKSRRPETHAQARRPATICVAGPARTAISLCTAPQVEHQAEPAPETTALAHRAPARCPLRSTRENAARVTTVPPEQTHPAETGLARAANTRPTSAASRPRSAPQLGAAEAAFYLDRQVRCCTEATLAGYRSDIGAFVSWLEGHAVTEPQQISAQHIREYLLEAQSRKLSVWTLHHYARNIRAFCNFLVSEETLTHSPMAKIRLPRLPKTCLPAFTPEEVACLLKAAQAGTQSARDTAMILALLDSGCRASEFLALTIGDVNLQTGQVAVRQGKGRKDRVTFIGAKACQAVVKYLQQRDRPDGAEPLWVTDEGTRLTTSGLRQLLERLAQRAGLSDVHPHKFRRTCALWSLRAGMNVFTLQMMMGHESLEMLRRYLALVQADLEQQHREHGAVDAFL